MYWQACLVLILRIRWFCELRRIGFGRGRTWIRVENKIDDSKWIQNSTTLTVACAPSPLVRRRAPTRTIDKQTVGHCDYKNEHCCVFTIATGCRYARAPTCQTVTAASQDGGARQVVPNPTVPFVYKTNWNIQQLYYLFPFFNNNYSSRLNQGRMKDLSSFFFVFVLNDKSVWIPPFLSVTKRTGIFNF